MPNHNWTAARIKKIRHSFGDTQEQFAARLRISTATLRFWERGAGQPSGPATIVLEQLEEKAEDLQPA